MKHTLKTVDLLSVTTGKLLGTMGGIYEVCNAMTRQSLFTHQLLRAAPICKEVIERQIPALTSGEFQFAYGHLIEMLAVTDDKDKASLILGWLSGLHYGKYGLVLLESYEIDDVDSYARYIPMDPIEEARVLTPNAVIAVAFAR